MTYIIELMIVTRIYSRQCMRLRRTRLIGKSADLKSAASDRLGVRVPRSPLRDIAQLVELHEESCEVSFESAVSSMNHAEYEEVPPR